MAETPVIRMMTRAELGDGTDGKQEERCINGKCAVAETHHPRCQRVSPQKAAAGMVQIRCGCAATDHCRNTGLRCGGAPCYVMLDELDLVNLTHTVVETRFLVTKQEEQRKIAAARKAAEDRDDE